MLATCFERLLDLIRLHRLELFAMRFNGQDLVIPQWDIILSFMEVFRNDLVMKES